MNMFLPLSRMARRFLLSNSNCTISKKKKQQPNKANTIEKKKNSKICVSNFYYTMN